MSIHNSTYEMIEAFKNAKCVVVLSDAGMCYLYPPGNDEAVVDALVSALNDQEFSQFMARAVAKAGNV